MPIRSRMSSILGQVEPECRELFALEFGKMAKYDFVYALSSANTDQSVPNLATIYMPIRSRMSSILGQIGPECRELFALEFGKMAKYDFVYALSSPNTDQSVPNLATIYMPIRSRMSSILGQIEPECRELFALEFGKMAEYDFFYTLSSTNINQSAPNLVKMYVIIRSRMSSIMDLIRTELSQLSALELKNLPYLNLFKI